MLTLARELHSLGWEVAICSGGMLAIDAPTGSAAAGTLGRSKAPNPEDYARAGVSHIEVAFPRLRRRRDVWRLLALPVAAWQVIQTAQRFRPSVVHSHSRQMGLYAALIHLLTGVPVVSTVHNPVPTNNAVWRRTMGDRVVAVSTEIQAIVVRDYGVPHHRVRVVPAGADALHFRPPSEDERTEARSAWGIAPGVFVLAFVGSLTPNKRPELLADAVASLVADGRDVVALVAGLGPSERGIWSQAHELGVTSRVRLLGYREARSVLWAADAFVLPSRSEGSPVVVAEAMLSGVPVLCSPAAAAQHVTPGVTGFVIRDEGTADMVRQIGELIDRPDLHARLAAQALDAARERVSSAGMARSIVATYNEAIELGDGKEERSADV